MEEVVLWVVLGAIAIAAAVFVAWVVLALVVRIFAWVLVLWAVTFGLGIAAGFLIGVVIPPGVLRGKATNKPKIVTPDDVVAGKVLGKAPRGPARNFGWDRAWPVYNPHQARHDANAVIARARAVVPAPFHWLFKQDLASVLAAVLFPPLLGFAIGAWISVLGWYCVMGVVGGAVYLGQQVAIAGYRSYDSLTRRRRKAILRCAQCYRTTFVPSYRCAGTTCTTVHHDVRPGPLGIVRRRCGCGTSIPATVGAAARHLATVCPFCLNDVPTGSGTRRVLPLPVIGSTGAGKTQFLSSGAVALRTKVLQLSGSLEPLSPVAESFLTDAAANLSARLHMAPTAWKNRPEGVPLLLTRGGRELELQLMDAAGEAFADWERARDLGYIDTADVLIFILDPLALPPVTDLLRVENKTGVVPIAMGDQESSYAAVVDRLRAEEVRIDAKRLAVVVTKVDVLRTLSQTEAFDPADGETIRLWLRANGADGFVRRIAQDFKNVSFFAVDSFGPRESFDPLHPLHVFDWAITTTDRRLSVLPPPAAVLPA
ncbi:hypothetical protein I6A60_05485 [Frankia sp. AgB1.9]|uniref:TRAFAC clade GTPase domain-containing protein n=1 Tax=unclassified Frankia TaxID=2632575 RepID=UPI0019316E1A|nr:MULTISPECIES: hypothetical protein [unclassified Frankia]MBL7489627.1 hypothetical protein [Frankia sp. AgW1.1]MBL7547334.1 hypothetical protein [Frankia sp. AgB1.9]MBL7618733.1 hypothetical protein [Frankia sp. AgB1.8]